MTRWLILLLLLLCSQAWGANLFVRQGASGSGTGADWTNACTGFSGSCAYSALGGDTAYVADGAYAAGTIPAANTTIKKCSPSDGVSSGIAGYSSTYCDGQATFSGGFTLADGADAFVLDGSYRDESDWGLGSPGIAAYGIGVAGGVGWQNADPGVDECPDDLEVRYVDLHDGEEGTTGPSSDNCSAVYMPGFGSGAKACTNWLIHRSYIHDCGHGTEIQCAGCDGLTVEYTLFKNSWGKEAIRGQVHDANMTVRWNQFHNACGNGGGEGEGCTGEIAMWSGNEDGAKVYGNSFFRDNGDGNSGGTIVIGGDGSSWPGAAADNVLVYNNTIAGISADQADGRILINGGTGNICRNNLWYDANNAGSITCGTSSDNYTAGADPFVDYAAGNLRLSGATSDGWQLPSPYDVDMDGATRGADGAWDVGAYEFDEGGGPDPPTNFRVIGTLAGLFLLGGLYASPGIFRSGGVRRWSRGLHRNRTETQA